MEEANKLLPTNNSLIIHLEAIPILGEHEHMPRERRQYSNSTAPNPKKWSHNWDWEAETTGRTNKVVAPESEETGEMADKFVLVGYQSLLDKMMDMSIASLWTARPRRRPGRGKGSLALARAAATRRGRWRRPGTCAPCSYAVHMRLPQETA